MKNLWRKYQSQCEEQRQNPLAALEKTRAKGAQRYILFHAFLWTLIMHLLMPLTDYLFERTIRRELSASSVILYFTGGLILGALNWWRLENEHQKLLSANGKTNCNRVSARH